MVLSTQIIPLKIGNQLQNRPSNRTLIREISKAASDHSMIIQQAEKFVRGRPNHQRK